MNPFFSFTSIISLQNSNAWSVTTENHLIFRFSGQDSFSTKSLRSLIVNTSILICCILARRVWKYDLDSKRLADIEEKILEFKRGEEEIPGWLVPQIYLDYVQNGNAEALKGVFYHNEIDVVSLAAFMLKINHLLSSNEFNGQEDLSIGEVFHKAGKFDLANDYFKHALEKNPEGAYRVKALLNLGFSLKNQGKFAEMCLIWEELAGEKSILACVELAKFFEHRKKDCQAALEWTEKALILVESGDDSSLQIKMLSLNIERTG